LTIIRKSYNILLDFRIICGFQLISYITSVLALLQEENAARYSLSRPSEADLYIAHGGSRSRLMSEAATAKKP
jgi:hypothetical protein